MAKDRHGSCQSDASTISDEALVEATRGGRLDTFHKLYERHAPTAWRTALAITGNVHDAADAVAEAFSRVLWAVPAGQLDDAACFRPYLLTATRNSALDILRHHARVKSTDDTSALDQPVFTSGPSEQVVASADASMVAAAFAALPERWRTVLWLTEVEGCTPTDAASALHTSPNAVAQLGVRARAGLRRQFIQAHLHSDAAQGCRSTVKTLGPYVAGSLSAKATARVDNHVANCPTCAGRLAELNELCTSLRRVALPLIPATLAARAAARSKAVGYVAAAASRHGALATLPVISAKPLAGAALGIIGAGVIGASVMGQSSAPVPQPVHRSANRAADAPPGHTGHIGPAGSSPLAYTPLASPNGPAAGIGLVAAVPGTTPVSTGALATGALTTGATASGPVVSAPPSVSTAIATTARPTGASPAAGTPGSGATTSPPTRSPTTSPTTTSPARTSRTPLVQVTVGLPAVMSPVSAAVGVGPGSCTGVGASSLHVGCRQPAPAGPSLSVSGSLVDNVWSTLGLAH